MNKVKIGSGLLAAAPELKNEYLHVRTAPWNGLQEARFDRTGFITQVTLLSPDHPGGNQHTFCVSENRGGFSGRGGCGICNEFGIKRPVGYNEAAAGQQFPKIGVGLLTKTDDDPYHFHESYPVDPFEVEVEKAAEKIRYTVQPRECQGYSMTLVKSVSVRKNRMTLSYELVNTGSKIIDTEEYTHNFIGINDRPAGPEYMLRFPEAPRFLEVESGYTIDLLEIQENSITWKRMPDRPFYGVLPPMHTALTGWSWELTHESSRAGVREYNDFDPAYVALWGEGHVISPEVFNRIVIKPGECRRWTRSYEFFTW